MGVLRNHPLSIEAIFPTGAVVGGWVMDYFSNHPLSIEAIFPTGSTLNSLEGRHESNHPLSIEAIFPTRSVVARRVCRQLVTILCQSRLFSPQQPPLSCLRARKSNHPLSIEAIFPTSRLR